MKKYLAALVTLVAFISLSGCYFENITSGLNQSQESRGAPIATLDGTLIYRAVRQGSASTSFPIFLQMIDSSRNITTVAGNSTAAVTDGIGTAASFKDIKAMVVQPGTPATIYVADDCVVRKVDTSNWQVSTILGSATNCFDLDGTGTAASFNRANDLVLEGNNLYVATDTTIKKVNLTNLTVTTIAGTTNVNGYVDATGTSAKFWAIKALVLVGGNFYAFDVTNQRIRKISLSTAAVSTVAGDGTEEILDGLGTASRLGITANNKATTDGADFIFFTDVSSVRKFKISTSEISTIVGANPEDAEGLIGTEARSFFPTGITYTLDGLYISNFFGVTRLR